jgi:hypothetical protein
MLFIQADILLGRTNMKVHTILAVSFIAGTSALSIGAVNAQTPAPGVTQQGKEVAKPTGPAGPIERDNAGAARGAPQGAPATPGLAPSDREVAKPTGNMGRVTGAGSPTPNNGNNLGKPPLQTQGVPPVPPAAKEVAKPTPNR